MALTKYTASTAIIAALDDLPNATGGLTAAQLKAKFDENPAAFKAFVNALIDQLEATADGSSGADQIGATSITGLTGATVQALIESLKTYADNLSMGAVADGAVTNAKLATDVKVGSLAALNTTTKTSVVAAINEHLADTTPHATIQGVDKFGLSSATTLTIASGAITVTKSFHLVDTEAAASSDDLDTINGGTTGDVLYLKQVSVSRSVTIKGNGTGNIYTLDRSDIVMGNSTAILTLLKVDSTTWVVVGIQGVKRSGDTMTGYLILNNNVRVRGLTTGGVQKDLVYVFTDDTINVGQYNNSAVYYLGTATIRNGSGSPEGVVTAAIGGLYLRTEGSTGTTLYVKESGSGNTGWVAK